MFQPLLLPASAVFEEADLKRVVDCVCGNKECISGKLVCWSHHVDDEKHGWFCICRPECYLTHVTLGGTQ